MRSIRNLGVAIALGAGIGVAMGAAFHQAASGAAIGIVVGITAAGLTLANEIRQGRTGR